MLRSPNPLRKVNYHIADLKEREKALERGLPSRPVFNTLLSGTKRNKVSEEPEGGGFTFIKKG